MPVPAGGMTSDPTAGADTDSDSGDNVICTITSDGQGGFTVFAGDEPESGGAGDTDDLSADDYNGGEQPGGMTGMGAAPAPQGQPADSVGSALKIVMGILQGASSGGGAGGGEDAFSAGFGAGGSTPPSGKMNQKY
jgi:hypothetical protein